MSVQAVSRIAALLALDADKLRDFLPNADGSDDNEENRADLVHLYRHQLDGGAADDGGSVAGSRTADTTETDLLLDGDMNAIYQYVAAHLPRPVNGDQTDG